MDMDLNQTARAREWLAAAEHKWRLQTMQTSTRYDMKTGAYRRLPTKVRRFLNGTPVGMIAEVLEVLRESAPYKSPVFNHEDGDLVYYPTNTYINKDGNPNVTNEKDATYTIVQDLRLHGDASDLLEAGDSSSCSEVTTAEYHWDESEVEALPDGEQGVSWRIDGVRRDDESGLLSYDVKKRQAVTQHTPKTLVKTTTRSSIYVESWENLYGVPGDFRYDPVKGGSQKANVPAASCGDGSSVELSITENPDCTYNVKATYSDALGDDEPQLYSIVRDQFRIQSVERLVGQPGGLPRSGTEYDPSRGTVTKYTSEKNEDGTWSNTTEVDTERAVSDSTRSVRVTPRWKSTSWTDTNMTSAADSVPGKYGEFKSTKTPAGRYVNEYMSYSPVTNAKLATTCEYDLFAYTHETTTGASSVENPSTSHIVSNGVTKSVRFSVDDSGFVSKTTRDKHERTVDNAVVTKNSTAFGTTTTTLYRNKSASAAGSLSTGALGRKYAGSRVSRTEGDLRDVETTVHAGSATTTDISSECSKTLFEHHDSTTSAGGSGTPPEVDAASGGRVTRKSVAVDAGTGFVTQRTETTQELEVMNSSVEKRYTARGTVTTVRNRNTTVDPTAGDREVGMAVSKERTPGGLLNTTVTKTVPNEGTYGRSCEVTRFKHADSSVSASSTPGPEHASGGSGGVTSRTESRLGDDGLWENSSTTTQELSVPNAIRETRVTSRGTFRSHTDIQVAAPPGEPNQAGTGLKVETTPGGLVNVTVTEAPVPKQGDTGKDCDQTVFQHSHTRSRTSSSNGSDHAESVSKGHFKTHSRKARLGDDGLWDIVETDVEEKEVECTSAEYEDASVRKTDKRYDNSHQETRDGGVVFDQEKKIQSISRQVTPGGSTHVVVSMETPKETHTPLYRMEEGTNKGLKTIIFGITFRNSTWKQVQEYIQDVVDEASKVKFGDGSLHANPHISVAPNKYYLYDGSVTVTLTYTPKAFAAGGSTADDNWSRTYTQINVDYQLVSAYPLKLLKIETTEHHRSGGGVGKSSFEGVVGSSAKVKGSRFSYSPGGQSFTYDFIEQASVKYSIVEGGTDTIA